MKVGDFVRYIGESCIVKNGVGALVPINHQEPMRVLDIMGDTILTSRGVWMRANKFSLIDLSNYGVGDYVVRVDNLLPGAKLVVGGIYEVEDILAEGVVHGAVEFHSQDYISLKDVPGTWRRKAFHKWQPVVGTLVKTRHTPAWPEEAYGPDATNNSQATPILAFQQYIRAGETVPAYMVDGGEKKHTHGSLWFSIAGLVPEDKDVQEFVPPKPKNLRVYNA